MRNFTINNAPQGSDLWLSARAGFVTGSKADKVLMGKTTAGRHDYLLQLAVERITGSPQEEAFINDAMIRGTEMEPLARVAVEQKHGIIIRESGFCQHKERKIGASLDGDIDDFDCIFETKSPKSTTHVGYLTAGVLPKQYTPQVMHNILVTGANRFLFASYDDRLPDGLQLFTVEGKASDLPIAEYEKALEAFLKEVDKLEAQLRERMKA